MTGLIPYGGNRAETISPLEFTAVFLGLFQQIHFILLKKERRCNSKKVFYL